MKTYTEFLSVKSIFYFCSLPLRLDSYKGCAHGCLYCFSQSLNNRKEGFFNAPIPAPVDGLEKKLNGSLSKNRKGIVNSMLSHRVPIHFGSVSDPFQPAERKFRISLNYLKVLNQYKYPTVISTKSDLITEADYLEQILELQPSVQFSFSTLDDNLAKELEPNASLPSERLNAIKLLSSKGIWVSIRLQPFLYPYYSIDDIDFSLFSKVGVKHVVLEHLRIPTNSKKSARTKLFSALGIDILDYYKQSGLHYSRINYELNLHHRLDNIKMARDLIHKSGMSFGAGDNSFHHISDDVCCCGIPNNSSFSNIYQGHIGYCLHQSVRNRELDFSGIDDQWQPTGSAIEFINSHCRNKKQYDLHFLMKYAITHPQESNSPSSFFGIESIDDTCYTINMENIERVLGEI